jgi:site-specific recombinase XerD
MKNAQYLSPWIKRFLLEYLDSTRNLSKNTQLSYRDTFRLLLPFIAKKIKKAIDKLLVDDIGAGAIKAFLTGLETNRGWSLSTRNQRLGVIHAFAKFIGLNNPEYLEWCRQIQMIPFKKTNRTLITYLEKIEMDALLNAPDKKTDQGKRDHALLLFLYNTGARSDEAAQLKIADIYIPNVPKRNLSTALIRGKGNKLRRCPLWQQTIDELSTIIVGRNPPEHVFLNRSKQPLTRFGIYIMVSRYGKQISKQLPSMGKKRISPHTIRHTTATHLLRAGVDINTIRAWLGHVSINTTNIYAEVDLDMKAKALACCEITEKSKPAHWRDNKDLMSFLDSI